MLNSNLSNNIRIIDLSDESYDQDTYYPCVSVEDIPVTRNYKIEVSADLGYSQDVANTGSGHPSWSTHTEGFSCHGIAYYRGNGWSAHKATFFVYDYNCSFCTNNVNPISFSMIHPTNQNLLYLRGGGIYKVYSEFKTDWEVHTEDIILDLHGKIYEYKLKSLNEMTFPIVKYNEDFMYSSLYANLEYECFLDSMSKFNINFKDIDELLLKFDNGEGIFSNQSGMIPCWIVGSYYFCIYQRYIFQDYVYGFILLLTYDERLSKLLIHNGASSEWKTYGIANSNKECILSNKSNGTYSVDISNFNAFSVIFTLNGGSKKIPAYINEKSYGSIYRIPFSENTYADITLVSNDTVNIYISEGEYNSCAIFLYGIV